MGYLEKRSAEMAERFEGGGRLAHKLERRLEPLDAEEGARLAVVGRGLLRLQGSIFSSAFQAARSRPAHASGAASRASSTSSSVEYWSVEQTR